MFYFQDITKQDLVFILAVVIASVTVRRIVFNYLLPVNDLITRLLFSFLLIPFIILIIYLAFFHFSLKNSGTTINANRVGIATITIISIWITDEILTLFL